MAGWNPRANEVFLNALDLSSEAERRAYLETACGVDVPLQQAVESLLRAHASASGFLERPGDTAELMAEQSAPTVAVTQDGAGSLLAGRYKLVEPIGEGGMGTVWSAEQLEPIRRQVAVKLIKPGLDSAQVIARFQAERQVLALMDHPNIARVFDAGTVGPVCRTRPDAEGRADGPARQAGPTGRPYFVMELVKGIPITRYCDLHQLTSRQRLELMVPVCQAIQHAHQKGIIHRDLKPSNVLVAAYDGKPVPKVIDFGIAKAFGQRLTEGTPYTGFGNILGTLEYMSPEQAEFNALDIDTRCDVYSLGVLLYELLTGTTPLTRQRLEKASVLEVFRLIREEEPPAPSSRGRSGEPSRTDAARLATPTELDWIVMKALEKDRNRRYETANALARDIERYLRDEAVEACPPSTTYRVKKFVARHRPLVLGTVLVVLALTCGIVGTTWGLLRALAAEKTAEAETRRADGEKQLAELQREKALAAEAETRSISDFILFEVLVGARLKVQGTPSAKTIAEVFAEAEKNIAERFKDKPTAEAAMRHAFGLAWRNLPRFDAAENDFRRAWELRRRHLGEKAALTLASRRCLGATLSESGRPAAGIVILEETLHHLRAALGSDDKETLRCLDNLAAAYSQSGRLADSLKLQIEAVERGERVDTPDSGELLHRMDLLADTYMKLKQPTDGAAVLEKFLSVMKKVSPTHVQTLEGMKHLAAIYESMKDFDKASTVYKELAGLQKQAAGTSPNDKLQTFHSLVLALAEAGRFQELEPLLKNYLDREMWASLGPVSKPLVRNFNQPDDLLAAVTGVLLRKGEYAQAETYLRKGLKGRATNEPASVKTADTRTLLVEALLGQKNYADAAPLLVQAYEQFRKEGPTFPPAVRQQRLIETIERLVQLYDDWGKKDEANSWRKKLDEAKAAQKKAKP